MQFSQNREKDTEVENLADKNIKISVVMAVHNGEQFLKGTLDSVLSQTMPDFECIVINDFSQDRTSEILKEYSSKDSRIKVYDNEVNLKLAKSLNKGIALASGKYIARLDADDICLKNRFEAQLAFMESHPEIDVSSCKFFSLREGVLTPSYCGRKTDSGTTAAMMLFFCPLLHPGVIAKAEVLKSFEYNPERTCSEDYDMWTRMTEKGYKAACQKDYLMAYRIHGAQITSTTTVKQHDESKAILTRFYENVAFKLSEEETDFLINKLYFGEKVSLDRLADFYKKICRECGKKGIIEPKNVLPGMIELLAHQNHEYPMSRLQQLKFLKFGGLRFVTEFIKRKKIAGEDFANAFSAAQAEGWEQLPVGPDGYPKFKADI